MAEDWVANLTGTFRAGLRWRSLLLCKSCLAFARSAARTARGAGEQPSAELMAQGRGRVSGSFSIEGIVAGTDRRDLRKVGGEMV